MGNERTNKEPTKPFVHELNLHGAGGKPVKVDALFDDGSMVAGMSTEFFEREKGGLGVVKDSSRRLRMANGEIENAWATWSGTVDVDGVKAESNIEIFDSGGRWDFLFGKPLLSQFNAVHDYKTDEILIQDKDTSTVITNQFGHQHSTPVCVITEDVEDRNLADETEVPTEGLQTNTNLFTRSTDPFKSERVEEVLRLVTIGEDLTEDEKLTVRELLAKWADVFALSVSEVKPEGAIHRLDISEDASFSCKVNQKPLTPPQRKYLHTSIDTMLAADIIEPCEPGKVKCVSPTTLAQKTHQGAGLTLEELQH